jgi:Family of unknown function (DUF5683)
MILIACINKWCCRAVACWLLMSHTTVIQLTDTTRVFESEFRQKFSNKWHMQPHSPLRATLYSAMLPGAGQIYNGNKKEGSVFKKYWKVPVVYAGVATCVYYINWNTKNFRYFKQQYIFEQDDDPNTIAEQTTQNGNEFWMEKHRKWMEISYFSLAGVYLLQILEANIDAHLFYFDVSNNLSLGLHPTLIPAGKMQPGIGLNMRF